jgi:alpha-beta hydrolase superfamily lysophospholipase
VLALVLASAVLTGLVAPSTDTVVLRGRPQAVHVYGERSGIPVIVSSGDGGWIHLAPHVAETLAAHGFFVVGFNVKRYLESFTADGHTLGIDEVPRDYLSLVEFAARGTPVRPMLIGVSEGAGLSVLAAADPQMRTRVAGVIALGLPDRNELGWRWKDSLIYVTHGVPDEPTFSASDVIGRLTPVPLAAIHSTRDEFVPESDVRNLMARASEPKRLWMVAASDHRFSGNVPEFDRRLLESIEWVRRNQPRA